MTNIEEYATVPLVLLSNVVLFTIKKRLMKRTEEAITLPSVPSSTVIFFATEKGIEDGTVYNVIPFSMDPTLILVPSFSRGLFRGLKM